MTTVLLNPVSGAAFSALEPPAATFEIGPNQIARLDPAAAVYVVQAPAAPFQGAAFAVLDVTGAAATDPITVDGNGATIDGAASVELNTARALGVFVFTGTEWRRIGGPPFRLELAGVDAPPVLNFARFDATPAASSAAIAAALATAEADATAKADAAEAAAIATASADATTKANAAQATAIATASADATAKADAAVVAARAATLRELFWSPADQGEAFNATKAGNFTFGFAWQFLRPASVTGVRFFGSWAGTKSVKIRVYNATDAVLVYTETFSAVASGLQSRTFAAAQSLARGKVYAISAWVTDATVYLGWTYSTALLSGNTYNAGYPSPVGPSTVVRGAVFVAGDGNPTTANTTEYASIEPVFSTS